jgi:hypothetical protein
MLTRLKNESEILRAAMKGRIRELSEVTAERNALREVNEHKEISLAHMRNEISDLIKKNATLEKENQMLVKKV